MADCIFCSIARGSVAALTVYENADVVAFMDKNPINPGHVLIIPRVHEANLQDLSEALYLQVARAARQIARAVNAAFSPKKVGIAVAGFDIPHAHLHVIPLHDYHDLTSRRYVEGGTFHRAGEGTGTKPAWDELRAEAERVKHWLTPERCID